MGFSISEYLKRIKFPNDDELRLYYHDSCIELKPLKILPDEIKETSRYLLHLKYRGYDISTSTQGFSDKNNKGIKLVHYTQNNNPLITEFNFKHKFVVNNCYVIETYGLIIKRILLNTTELKEMNTPTWMHD